MDSVFSASKGSHCEFPTCESVLCRNNGTCTPGSQRGFSCNCSRTGRSKYSFVRISDLVIVFFPKSKNIGYEDEQCMTEIDECLSNPCRNNATCIDRISEYYCQCTESFAGLNCKNKINKQH